MTPRDGDGIIAGVIRLSALHLWKQLLKPQILTCAFHIICSQRNCCRVELIVKMKNQVLVC